MRFDFYCENRSGSSSFVFTPLTYYSRGLGGAEYALVNLTETLVALGHQVNVWNTPIDGEGVYNGVSYHNVDNFDLYDRYDIFICYRNPFAEFPYIQANVRGWFSTDQVTCGDYALDIRPFSDLNITISPYHRQFHIDTYGFDPDKIVSIDLGVRVGDYDKPIEKVKNRLLYCSVPSRGLAYLKDIFPKIRQQIPDAELYVSSDFSLWGHGIGKHNEEYVEMFKGMDGVNFLGKVPREQLVELQLSSDLLVYPNAPSAGAYPENFSVSLAEAQVAGCIPITSGFGGLVTTVLDADLNLILDDNDAPLYPSSPEYQERFVSKAVGYLKAGRESLTRLQQETSQIARERFAWNNIAQQWLDVIEKTTKSRKEAFLT